MWFDEPAPAFERDVGPTLRFAAWASAALMIPLLPWQMGRLMDVAETAAAALF
jgi:NADH-quinone oxidoreductase subunit N